MPTIQCEENALCLFRIFCRLSSNGLAPAVLVGILPFAWRLFPAMCWNPQWSPKWRFPDLPHEIQTCFATAHRSALGWRGSRWNPGTPTSWALAAGAGLRRRLYRTNNRASSDGRLLHDPRGVE